MGLRVTNESTPDVHISQMKDGEVAVIVGWTYSSAIGKVVHRYGDNLIPIGHPRGQAWTGINTIRNDSGPHGQCRVRILSPGTTFVLEK